MRSPQDIPRPQLTAAPAFLLAGTSAGTAVSITPPGADATRLRRNFAVTVFVRNAALSRKLASSS